MTSSKTQASLIDRRRFLEYTWCGVGASLSLALLPGHEIFAAPRFGDDPFTLGVASGDPTATASCSGRASRPSRPIRRASAARRFRWAGASPPTAACSRWSRAASPTRQPDLAHSVHVEVNGLQPGRDYFYQFNVRGEESAIGHFRTAPRRARAAERAPVRVRDLPGLAERLLHRLSRHAAERSGCRLSPRRLHLRVRDRGDDRRGIPVPEASARRPSICGPIACGTRCYKLDPDLQAAHAKFPFVVIWDDHEVANDYSGLAPELRSPSPEFTARRAAAYQAYYEHMPIRLSVALNPRPGLRIYRRLRYGRAGRVHDARRPAVPLRQPVRRRRVAALRRGADGHATRCSAASRSSGSREGFAHSSARWNIVAQQLLIAQLEHATIRPNWFWNDAWDGYPLARKRLLADVVGAGCRNPVFLTGDWHSTFVNDLKLDFNDPGVATVATEFVTPAITTGGDGTPYGPYYAPMIPVQPAHQVLRRRSARLLQGDGDAAAHALDLRFMTRVESQAGIGYTEGSWVVEDGRPGASAPERRATAPADDAAGLFLIVMPMTRGPITMDSACTSAPGRSIRRWRFSS